MDLFLDALSLVLTPAAIASSSVIGIPSYSET